jgi:hypothetical protein
VHRYTLALGPLLVMLVFVQIFRLIAGVVLPPRLGALCAARGGGEDPSMAMAELTMLGARLDAVFGR